MEGISLIFRIFSQHPLRPAFKAGLFRFFSLRSTLFHFNAYLVCPFLFQRVPGIPVFCVKASDFGKILKYSLGKLSVIPLLFVKFVV